MADASLSKNYARAVFEKAVDKYVRDLHTLDNALNKSNLLTRLDNANESFDSKKALVNGLLPANADSEVRNLAYLLASKNQMGLLGDVVREFERMVASGAPGTVGQITSAIELTPEEKTKLEAKLHQQYGQELAFNYLIDPSIVGGIVVRVGDIVIDGSVTGKLAAMKQKLEGAR
jgi:F-type H+-transporting ATPase subunit delta